MDELKRYPSSPTVQTRPRRSLSTSRRNRSYVTMAFLGLGLFFIFIHVRPLAGLHHFTPWQTTRPLPVPVSPPPTHLAEGKLVALEAHIMSKCPDARDCLKDLVIPVMQKAYDKVNFTLSFIGSPAGDSGVACKHGPAECMGNILELCAAQLYPDPKTYLGFTMCISNDYQDIPNRSLVEPCALEHALDLKALNDCATRDSGAFGEDMLRQSVQHTIDAGVKTSCTVRVDEKVWCIRDGGAWIDCPQGSGVDTLVTEIVKRYQGGSGESSSA